MQVIKITKDNFKQEVLDSEKPVLLDFWSERCAPCRAMSPVIEKIASEREDIKVGKVNVDEEGELAADFNIMGIPSVFVIKNGRTVARCGGARPKNELMRILDTINEK